MSWPTPQDYNELVQTPAVCFSDPDLQSSTVSVNQLGLPVPCTGGFATVYKLEASDKQWAVRCFLQKVSDQQLRYRDICDFVQSDTLPYTVHFEYLQSGIRFSGVWYPILKMEWVDGDTLDNFVREHLHETEIMSVLLANFRQMVRELREAGLAHGDLQHGNIIVLPNLELRLVDYDGMYVPAMTSNLFSNELGHRNYQHPMRSESDFDSNLDTFSTWVIYISLYCLTVKPELWQEVIGGDDCMLFRQSDFVAPTRSNIFRILEDGCGELQSAGRMIRQLLSCDLKNLKALPDNHDEVIECCRAASKWYDETIGSEVFETESLAEPNPVNLPSLVRARHAIQSKSTLAAKRWLVSQKVTVGGIASFAWHRTIRSVRYAFSSLEDRAYLLLDEGKFQDAVRILRIPCERWLGIYHKSCRTLPGMEYYVGMPYELSRLIPLLARCYILMKDFNAAHQLLVMAIPVYSRHGTAGVTCRFLLACVLYSMGNRYDALKYLDECSVESIFSEAMWEARGAIGRWAGFGDTLLEWANSLRLQKSRGTSYAYLAALQAYEPILAWKQLEMARCYECLDKLDKAQQIYRSYERHNGENLLRIQAKIALRDLSTAYGRSKLRGDEHLVALEKLARMKKLTAAVRADINQFINGMAVLRGPLRDQLKGELEHFFQHNGVESDKIG